MKLKFIPKPTFKAEVLVPVAGEKDPQSLLMTFKHLSVHDSDAVMKKAVAAQADTDEKPASAADVAQSMVDHVMGIAEGWEFDVEFNADNVAKALAAYAMLYSSILTTYTGELYKQRAKP